MQPRVKIVLAPFAAVVLLVGVLHMSGATAQSRRSTSTKKSPQTKSSSKRSTSKSGSSKSGSKSAKSAKSRSGSRSRGTAARRSRPARLPQYFAQVKLTDEQRDEVYSVQAEYAVKIAKVQDELAELKQSMAKDLESVLTTTQKRKLSSLRRAGSAGSTAKKTATGSRAKSASSRSKSTRGSRSTRKE